jgi:uncharacterized iron-regulated protein
VVVLETEDYIRIWEDYVGDSGEAPTDHDIITFGKHVELESLKNRKAKYDKALVGFETNEGLSESDYKEFAALSEHYMYAIMAMEREIYGDD